MLRQIATTLLTVIAGATISLTGIGVALAGPGDVYISNPTANPDDQQFCDDQAALANNLAAGRDYMRADQVTSAANMKGCRVFTFQSP